ncbi:MAG: hypothetical protein ACI9SE_003313 [Neolewinella sp.]|jgi:hypothetical protein
MVRSLFVVVMLVFVSSVTAQGVYHIKVGALNFYPHLDTAGVVRIEAGGPVLPGWSWEVIDTDGDGKVDDVRISDPGNGKLDLPDGGGASTGDNGDIHDGSVAYPNNQIPGSTWEKL